MDQPTTDGPADPGVAALPEAADDSAARRARELGRRRIPWEVAALAILAVGQLVPGISQPARWVFTGAAILVGTIGEWRYKAQAQAAGIKRWNRTRWLHFAGVLVACIAIGVLAGLTTQKAVVRPAAVGDCFFVGTDQHLYRVPCGDSRATLTGTQRVSDASACPGDTTEVVPIRGDPPHVLCLAAVD